MTLVRTTALLALVLTACNGTEDEDESFTDCVCGAVASEENSDGGAFAVDADASGVQDAAAVVVEEISGSADTEFTVECARSQALGIDNYILGITFEGKTWKISVEEDATGDWDVGSPTDKSSCER